MKLYFEESKTDNDCLWLKQMDNKSVAGDFVKNGVYYKLMRITPTFLGRMMCRLSKQKINSDIIEKAKQHGYDFVQ